MFFFFAESQGNLVEYRVDQKNLTACIDAKNLSLTFTHNIELVFGDPHAEGMNDGPMAGVQFAVVDAKTISDSDPINEYNIPVIDSRTHAVISIFKCRITRIPQLYLPFLTRKIDFSKQIFIGHRGHGSNRSGSRIRENTMLSFNHTLAHANTSRLSGIELDVMLTLDRRLVVFHDLEYPVRVDGVETLVPVPSMKYSDMRRKPLRRRRSSPSSAEGIEFLMDDCPVLESVLKGLIPDHAGIVIEIKYPTNETIRRKPALGAISRYELAKAVLDCLDTNREYIRNRWIVVSSFDPDIVSLLHRCVADSNIVILHNTWFGHENDGIEDDTVDFSDVRNRNPLVAVQIAREFRSGIAVEASFALGRGFTEHFCHVYDVPLFTYGRDNMSLENIKRQERISGFFIDNLNVIKSTS